MRGLCVLPFMLLAGCVVGGGDPSDERCSEAQTLVVSVTWNSNGNTASTVSGKLNQPLVATPTVVGVPLSCKGQESYVLPGGVSLPRGLGLNLLTGAITGTPLETKSIGMTGLVSMKLPGYSAVPVLGIINITP